MTNNYGRNTLTHVVYRKSVDPEEYVLKHRAVYLARTRATVKDFNTKMLRHFEHHLTVHPWAKVGEVEPVELAIGAPVMFYVRAVGSRDGSKTYNAVNGTIGMFSSSIIC